MAIWAMQSITKFQRKYTCVDTSMEKGEKYNYLPPEPNPCPRPGRIFPAFQMIGERLKEWGGAG